MVRRLKLEIAYHGQLFHGWQKQRDQRTVQGELHEALTRIFRGHQLSVVGASRTDTGVHAAGQVAHLDLPGPIPPDALIRGLNSGLPRQIRVLSARPVPGTFHARKSALGKLYTYRARWREPRLPWFEPRSATVTTISDFESFSAALDLLVGRHDWASFTVPNPETESTTRTLFGVRFRHRQKGIDVDFLGEGFLRYQVRRMVGALLEIGSGDRHVDELRELIESPSPGSPIRTAPAQGLCLEHIYYRKCPAVTGAQSPTKSSGTLS
jgi:tRNA pseudouridine38-40 synthase